MSGNSIPSLINGAAGRPVAATAGKKSPCRGCGGDISKGEKCFDIPNPRASFSTSRRFCRACFKGVLEKTKQDLAALQMDL